MRLSAARSELRGVRPIVSNPTRIEQFSSTNPARSRIRVITDDLNDVYVPIRAGDYTPAECTGRHTYTINEKEYKECSFCGVACPARDYFKEPDSGLPLKCDMCESDPSLEVPLCVQWCLADALTYEEVVEEVAEGAEEVTLEELDTGLAALAHKHGWSLVIETVDRMKKKD